MPTVQCRKIIRNYETRKNSRFTHLISNVNVAKFQQIVAYRTQRYPCVFCANPEIPKAPKIAGIKTGDHSVRSYMYITITWAVFITCSGVNHVNCWQRYRLGTYARASGRKCQSKQLREKNNHVQNQLVLTPHLNQFVLSSSAFSPDACRTISIKHSVSLRWNLWPVLLCQARNIDQPLE